MRVLVLTPKILDESLSASTRLNVYDALSRRVELHVVARMRNPDTWSERTRDWVLTPVRAVRIPIVNMLRFHLVGVLITRRLLSSVDFDAILVEPDSLPTALLARRLSRREAAIVLDVRTLPVKASGIRAVLARWTTELNVRCFAHRCDGITAISPGVAQWIAKNTHIDASDISIWSTGVDAHVFDPSRFESTRSHSDIRFLYHGAIYLSRGLGELIAAAARLRELSDAPFTVDILGAGPDREDLVDQIRELDLATIVHIRDSIPAHDVPAAISDSDIGIIPLPDLPCWRTSSPTKLLEYMSMQRPVVLTAIEAHTAVVGDGEYAIWAGTGAADQLAEGMKHAQDRFVPLKIAAAKARQTVLTSYSWEQQAAVVLSSLTSAVARRQGTVTRRDP